MNVRHVVGSETIFILSILPFIVIMIAAIGIFATRGAGCSIVGIEKLKPTRSKKV